MTTRPSPQAVPQTGLWEPAKWMAFCWGFAEGTFFFIVPDVILSWACLAGVKCGLRSLGAILAGSLVAGICMYSWAAFDPVRSQAAVASVPFVKSSMFQQVKDGYAQNGIYEMLRGPASGIPYKIYAVLAPPVSGPIAFVAVSLPARLERVALSWIVFTALGWFLKRWIQKHPKITAALFVGFWIVIYLYYWNLP